MVVTPIESETLSLLLLDDLHWKESIMWRIGFALPGADKMKMASAGSADTSRVYLDVMDPAILL